MTAMMMMMKTTEHNGHSSRKKIRITYGFTMDDVNLNVVGTMTRWESKRGEGGEEGCTRFPNMQRFTCFVAPKRIRLLLLVGC